MIRNYRPLSLACIDYKILAKIITERIKPSFFHRMKTNTKKEKNSLIDDKNLGKETRVPA